MKSSTNKKIISIIIPTKNEERNLPRCLNSIKNNGYKNIEIIIVDQQSTDKTKEIAKLYKTIFISVIKTKNYQPPSQSRNIGFSKSKGNFVLNLDADMELEKGLLKEIVDKIEKGKYSAIVIPEEDIPLNFWARAKAFERKISQGTDIEAARFVRRDVFEQVGYEKGIMSGEDWNIHKSFKQLGKIGRSHRRIFHHIGKISLRKEFLKKYSYGLSSNKYISKEKRSLANLFKKLLIIYFKNISSNIQKDPLLILGFIIIRGVDLFALILGLITEKFNHFSKKKQ